MSSPPAPHQVPTVRAILRVVVTVVLSVLALYLVYLLRTPLSWLVIATFVAVAAAGPVNILSRRIPRGAAIAIVYTAIVLLPVAVASYVGGALAQAAIAGVAAFLMLVILGVGSPLPLAVIIAVLDLIPLVGATLGAVIVGVVTLFTDFPTRIQSRAVQLDPFIVVIAGIFGGSLLGIVGALLAIPSAAAIQIAVREYMEYRRAYPAPGS